MGEGEVVTREVAREAREIWRPKSGWTEDLTRYLSVNGYTLDANQDSLDLREWTEKKWVLYLDCLSENEGPGQSARAYERPFPGGAY